MKGPGNVVSATDRHIFQTYSRYPVTLVRGEGVLVWDDTGRQYLDFLSGIAVCNLGHCHPAVVKSATDQLQQLMHVSNFFYTIPQVELSSLLTGCSFAEKVFFCNSGAEANEAALKLARKHAGRTGDKRFEIITMNRSFHGRTYATLTATGQEKIQKGFEPLLPGFVYVPFNDISALKSAVGPSTCAVMVEPIQGEGGVNVPDADYLQAVRSLCDRHDLLLIFDEVQVGMGRTGRMFAHEHFGVEPDIMTLAKALGGGLPAGAMLAGGTVANSFTPGSHASTFGGNPVVMAAGTAVMKELLHGGVLENCRCMGAYFTEQLNALQKAFPEIVCDVRGMGLILGMELAVDGRPVVNRCLEKGIIINCTLEKILRFLPPLTLAKEHVDQCVSVLHDVLSTM